MDDPDLFKDLNIAIFVIGAVYSFVFSCAGVFNYRKRLQTISRPKMGVMVSTITHFLLWFADFICRMISYVDKSVHADKGVTYRVNHVIAICIILHPLTFGCVMLARIYYTFKKDTDYYLNRYELFISCSLMLALMSAKFVEQCTYFEFWVTGKPILKTPQENFNAIWVYIAIEIAFRCALSLILLRKLFRIVSGFALKGSENVREVVMSDKQKFYVCFYCTYPNMYFVV